MKTNLIDVANRPADRPDITFVGKVSPPDYAVPATGCDRILPDDLLKEAAATISQRGAEYDKAEGERSIPETVALFNLHTGHKLSVIEGWKFMIFLKMVRAKANPQKRDSWVDGAAYFGLCGEEALNNNFTK